jgi:hypothetical protein
MYIAGFQICSLTLSEVAKAALIRVHHGMTTFQGIKLSVRTETGENVLKNIQKSV